MAVDYRSDVSLTGKLVRQSPDFQCLPLMLGSLYVFMRVPVLSLVCHRGDSSTEANMVQRGWAPLGRAEMAVSRWFEGVMGLLECGRGPDLGLWVVGVLVRGGDRPEKWHGSRLVPPPPL